MVIVIGKLLALHVAFYFFLLSCHAICFRASPTPKRGGVFSLHARHVTPKNEWPCFPDESLAANSPHNFFENVATPPNSPGQETNFDNYDEYNAIRRNESSERVDVENLLPRPYRIPAMVNYEKRIVLCENKIKFLQGTVEELMNAFIFCDDMALRERDVLQVFPLMFGFDGKEAGDDVVNMNVPKLEQYRKPILLRRTILSIMKERGMQVHPIEKQWRKNFNFTSET